ncbi:MAG: peptide deformylase [Oscillospiraceae bacterium]|nr:peptide deformylase [Oscillospiraceae bacterium]
MGIRKILTKGDLSLKKKSRVVTEFNPRLHQLLDDMRQTLEQANGVGLAAPQVGVLRRAVIVEDVSGDEPVIYELVNPEIVERSGEQIGPEGCLSLPDIWGIVTRPEHVKVKAQDRYGNEFELEADELLARACCHEIDHLEGVLFDEIADRFLDDEELAALSAEEE